MFKSNELSSTEYSLQYLILAGSCPRGGSLAFSLRRLCALSMASCPAVIVLTKARCGSDIRFCTSGYCAYSIIIIINLIFRINVIIIISILTIHTSININTINMTTFLAFKRRNIIRHKVQKLLFSK